MTENPLAVRKSVLINDVGPRDGLQNQSTVLTAEQRLSLINALGEAGLRAIEVGAFVSSRQVPAMASTDKIIGALPESNINYSALIPNRKGYDLACSAGVESVNLVVAASNTMNQENIGMSTERAMAVSREVIKQSTIDNVLTQAYIATAWECPFEGSVEESLVVDLAGQLLRAGVDAIVLADTIGAANPARVASLMEKLASLYGADKLRCHFHDTRGMGLANVYAALQANIRSFDTSIGGLGGCPFAPGATGNVATEDVVLMLEQMGFDTGIDLKKLVQATQLATELTGSYQGGHSLNWLNNQIEKGAL